MKPRHKRAVGGIALANGSDVPLSNYVLQLVLLQSFIAFVRVLASQFARSCIWCLLGHLPELTLLVRELFDRPSTYRT